MRHFTIGLAIGCAVLAVACGNSSNPSESAASPAASSAAAASPDDPPAASPSVALATDRPSNVPAGAREVTPDNGKGALRLPGPEEKGDGETHFRHRYELPPGANNVMAMVQWADTSWGEIKVAIGTGICPHRGKKLAESASSNGSATVQVIAAEIDPQSVDPWFLHINADAALETKAGQTLDYTFRVFAW